MSAARCRSIAESSASLARASTGLSNWLVLDLAGEVGDHRVGVHRRRDEVVEALSQCISTRVGEWLDGVEPTLEHGDNYRQLSRHPLLGLEDPIESTLQGRAGLEGLHAVVSERPPEVVDEPAG